MEIREIFREIILKDKGVLLQTDKFLEKISSYSPNPKDFAAIKKAIKSVNLCETFLVLDNKGDNLKTEAITQIQYELTKTGLREKRIKFVLDAFIYAFNWNTKNFSEKTTENENSVAIKKVIKGQRLILNGIKKMFIGFMGENICVDIDPYAFQLYGNGKTRQDKDLIFFGNMQSAKDAVHIAEKDGVKGVGVNLDKIVNDVEKIVIAFAVYEDKNNSSASFADVRNPLVRTWLDSDMIYDFHLNLGLEKVVNMVEIYKHKGEWKLKFVGSGFKNGLRRLCEEYGIDVE